MLQLALENLFVCGDAHRWNFRRRIEAKGIEVKLIAKRVGAQTLPRDYFDAYRERFDRGASLREQGAFASARDTNPEEELRVRTSSSSPGKIRPKGESEAIHPSIVTTT